MTGSFDWPARRLLTLALLGCCLLIASAQAATSAALATGEPPYRLYLPVTPSQEAAAVMQYAGLDFSNHGQLVKIKIASPNKRINGGKPIVIKFYPGQECSFGEQRACIQAYRTPSGQNVIFITVHSGLGAEAEAFRNAVEGTGFAQAGLSLEKVLARLGDLEGASVTIIQGDVVVDGLHLAGLGRVPAQGVSEYFASPVTRSIEFAAGYSESLAWAANPAMPLIVFETCGWRIRGEPAPKNLENSSASVYLGVIAGEKP